MTALSFAPRIECLVAGATVSSPFFWFSYKLATNESQDSGFIALILGLAGAFIFYRMLLEDPDQKADELSELYNKTEVRLNPTRRKTKARPVAEIIDQDNEVVGHTTYKIN
jgi:hypothetical protein